MATDITLKPTTQPEVRMAGGSVFIPFHWVFQKKKGRKKKKRKEKGRNCGKSSTFYLPS
jgi:hypothetical protein